MKFYDHAMNMANPAVASAVARCRKDAVRDGIAYRVEFTSRHNGERYFWEGCCYDVLQIAKQMHFNNHGDVTMTNPTGQPVDITATKY